MTYRYNFSFYGGPVIGIHYGDYQIANDSFYCILLINEPSKLDPHVRLIPMSVNIKEVLYYTRLNPLTKLDDEIEREQKQIHVEHPKINEYSRRSHEVSSYS